MTTSSSQSTPGAGRFDEAAFSEIVEEARAESARREREHELPREPIRRLLDAGLGSARIPRDEGGDGASVELVFERLIELAAADANLAHVFRGHLAFVEQQFFEPDTEHRGRWFERILGGAFVGNAQSELTATSDLATSLTDTADGLRLSGRKYYTTGSLYADWIDLSARYRDEDYQVIVSTHQDGVQSVDDWKGFGQKLTGSGTTVFDDAEVDASEVRPYSADDEYRHAYMMGFFQLVLLAVTAGVARAAVDDAVSFVQPRRRVFGFGGETLPRDNHLVQSVIGEASSSAFAVRAVVLEAARGLDRVLDDYRAGGRDPRAFTTAQLDVYRAQQFVLPTVVKLTGDIFEVGGASAVDAGLSLDRHWRNARTIATHNPAIHRRRAIGEWELNGTPPEWNIQAPPK